MRHIYFKTTTFLIFCFAIFNNINGQVKTKIFNEGIPTQFIPVNKSIIPEKVVAAPVEFLSVLNQPKSDNPIEYSNKFAVPEDIDLDIIANAKKIQENNITTFAITINAEKALNISLQFNKFFLSEHSVLSIYTLNELTDSITAKENNDNKLWATRVYQGSKLTIVLRVPTNEKEQVSLRINRVNFGFKKFGSEFFGHPGASAACNINVLCPEGNGWQNERNSVALIVANGYTECTGSLIMNTCNTNIPYFLTANHCLDADNVSNWVFQFQYWSATCAPNSGWREDIQFNGCTLRANSTPSDFALLQLNQTPQPTSGIFYSGWSRSANPPNGSVGLHHPEGDLMKFSRDFDPSGVSSWGGTNNHWVSVFEQGTVEPGSSGSPLYDMNHRIVGQLHGDQLNRGDYCNQRRGEYGRFDLSWTGGGTVSTRLNYWLDPSNSGALTTNTTNISALIPVPYTSISGADLFCSGTQTYTLNNAPAGATIIWNGTPSNLATLTPHGTTVDVTKTGGAALTLTASINFANCYPATKIVHMGTYGSSDYPVFGPTNATCNGYVTYTTNQLPGATSYNWFYPSSWTYVSGQGTYRLTLIAKGTNGNYQVGVRVDNTCGTAGSPAIINTFLSGCPNSPNYQISPNPATSDITVNPIVQKGLSDSKKLYISEINIYDEQGILRLHFKYNKVTTATLNVANLSSGIYIIEITNGVNKERQQIIIQQ